MQGYDENAAAAYIAPRVQREMGAECTLDVQALVRAAITLDLAYMQEAGVLDEDGFAGQGEYDEDDAFEYVLDGVSEALSFDEDTEMLAAQALEAFFACQQEYMEKAGLCQ